MKTPSPSEVLYMVQHAQDTKVPGMIACSVVCLSIATWAVASRFIARLTSKVKLRSSDWLILVALVFLALYVTAFLVTIPLGMGRHIIMLKNPKTLVAWMLVAETTITIAVLATKLSLCTLYIQIFPLPWLRTTSIIIMCVVAAYTVAHIVSDLLQCIPLSALWDPTVKDAKCYPFTDQMVAMASINIVTDIAILILPMKPIWSLQISRSRKWQLSAILSLGALACIVGAIRIPYVLKMGSMDSTWNDVASGEVSMIEPAIAITAACLPTCRSLYSRIFDVKLGFSRFYSKPMSLNFFSFDDERSRGIKLSENSSKSNIRKESRFELSSMKNEADEERLVQGHPHSAM